MLRKRLDTKVSVSNINTPEKSTSTDTKTSENKQRYQERTRSATPEKMTNQRSSYSNYDNRPPVTCYNCQQPGHVSRQCRNKKQFPISASGTFQQQSKPNIMQKQTNNVKQTRFDDEAKNEASLNNIHVRINAMMSRVSS